MEVDIVIIDDSKNESLEKILIQSLDTLLSSENNVEFNVYIVESNKDISFNYLYKNIKMVYPEETFGYHKYLNIGRKLGSAPYICLCNSDLIYHKNWATNIINKIKDNNIMSASPISNNPHHTIFKIETTPEIQLGYMTRRYISGWCIFQKRSIYEIIGDLDENFIFWYCDDDYGMTLKKHGIKHALITNSRVDHIVSVTLDTLDKETREKFTGQQKKIFDKKWN